jgi:hypothetical protein
VPMISLGQHPHAPMHLYHHFSRREGHDTAGW